MRTLRGRGVPQSAISERLGANPVRRSWASGLRVLTMALRRWSGRCSAQKRGAPGQSSMVSERGWPGSPERRCKEGGRTAWSELRVPPVVCALRAPWLGWRGGDAGTVALAAQAWRSPGAGAATWRSPGRALREHSVRRRAHSQHPPLPSLAAAARDAPRLPASVQGKAGWTRCTCDPRGERSQRRPSRRRDVTGNFLSGSWAAGACICEAVAPPASCSRLPTPPLPPASLPPSPARVLLP
jgi:hypothetical protein